MEVAKSPEYLACPDCDALFAAPRIREGERVICPRCGANLFSRRPNFVHRASAFVLAAAFFFILANAFPFLYPASRLSPKLYAPYRLRFRTGGAGIPGAGRHGRSLHARGPNLAHRSLALRAGATSARAAVAVGADALSYHSRSAEVEHGGSIFAGSPGQSTQAR